jgi:hypothetical protein
MNDLESKVYRLDRISDGVEDAIDQLRLKKALIVGVIEQRKHRLVAARDTIRECKTQLLTGEQLLIIEPENILHPDVASIVSNPTAGL